MGSLIGQNVQLSNTYDCSPIIPFDFEVTVAKDDCYTKVDISICILASALLVVVKNVERYLQFNKRTRV